VVITHEREVAAHAQRLITVRDGLIISDERQSPVLCQALQPAATPAMAAS